jgi:hypothetical protein
MRSCLIAFYVLFLFPAYCFGQTLTSTNLPIVVINTNGNTIADEPKAMVDFGIIYNGVGMLNHPTDPWNHYGSHAMIEYRGCSSQNFPQRSYAFKTVDAAGNTIDTPILGMPTEHDWCLVNTYNDKSLMRNAMTYELCNRMGFYASRTRFCEVMLDGQYMGVYILAEKIKRDHDRVDIAKLLPQDIAGDELTGGYIIKIDRMSGGFSGSWQSQYLPDSGTGNIPLTFQYDYPKVLDMGFEQQLYIQGYVDSFEDALHSVNFTDTNVGYKHYADINSFIDNFIIHEMSKNGDGLRVSYYMNKDKQSNGGKLKSGPVWDYDLAWHNADPCENSEDTGWGYMIGHVCDLSPEPVPGWWSIMLKDTTYANALKCRWEDLRSNVLTNQHIFGYIDSTVAYLADAEARHSALYPIFGIYMGLGPPSPIANTYAEEITYLKNWITQRTAWLDVHMPGTCNPLPTGINIISAKASFSVYPNPCFNEINFDHSSSKGGTLQIDMYSSLGQKVYSSGKRVKAGDNKIYLEIDPQLPSGTYLVRVSGDGINISGTILKRSE